MTFQKEIKMNPFVSFMASTTGRITRIVAGIALIAWGLMGIQGTAGFILAVVGLVPLVAGLFDFCVFAPLFGNPMSGPRIRTGR
jgi:type IV secretory pathway VirB2 component (pilin)